MNTQRVVVGQLNDPLFDFDNSQLRKVEAVLRSSFSGDELAYDELNVGTFAGEEYGLISSQLYDLQSNEGYDLVTQVDNIADLIPINAPVWYFINGNLVGKFYAQQVPRENMLAYDVEAISAIGVLSKRSHKGGMYNGEMFHNVAADIIGGTFAFSCSPEVQGIAVYNWLPYADDARENLHQLMFAYGVMIYKNSDGSVYFDFANTTLKSTISDDDVYVDGEEALLDPIDLVRVLEHSFIALNTDTRYVLFDNTAGVTANNTLVVFKEAPIHDLVTTGTLTINESGVNYAIVTGTGTLSGKKYTHTMQAYEIGTQGGSVLEYAEQYLVNGLNSINVAKRLAGYYSTTKQLNTAIQATIQRAGDLVRLSNPNRETVNAYIKEMTITGLATAKAQCEMLEDYTPIKGGNNYNNFQLLTTSGTFTVPAGVTMMRIVLCQGGQGGSGGYAGTRGDCGTAGVGGLAGKGGNPGQIFISDIFVTPGQTFSYTVGVGGSKGLGGYWNANQTTVTDPTDGTDGTHSTFGSYTSANGEIPTNGYVNILSGFVYAKAGEDGIDGADGGGPNTQGNSVTFNGTTWTGGAPAASLGNYSAIGGGGAAYGTNGGDATPNSSGNNGRGGAGATALVRSVTASLGSGGVAGNGGGGAGAGPYDRSICWGSAIGYAGNGADGNDGGAGFIFTFY